MKTTVQLLSFVEALRMIQGTHPQISDWMLRKDIIRKKIKVRQRETPKRGGWFYFELQDVQQYIKELK